MTHTTGTIQVHKSLSSFVVYGRFGAVMRADADRKIIYCNLREDAPEYKRMAKALKAQSESK